MRSKAGLILAGAGILFAGIAVADPGHQHGAPAARKGNRKLCPVMKAPMTEVVKAIPLNINNETFYLCCASCPDTMKKTPEKFLGAPIKDVVSRKAFKVTAKTPKVVQPNALFLFSSAATKATFLKNPTKYIKQGA